MIRTLNRERPVEAVYACARIGGMVKEWVTIREAAVLVGRHPSAIYRWIDQGRLATQVNADGVTEVLSKAVRRIEAEVRRGRPRGSVSRR